MVTQFETKQAKRTPWRSAGPAYWLIAKNTCGRIEVLTLDRDGARMLPVFGHEEEAEMFLQLGGAGDEWQLRESRAGELISVLYGPCAGVKEVALDPLPEMVAERTIGLVSLLRERFIQRLMAGRRLNTRGGSGRGSSSPREDERSLRSSSQHIGEWRGGRSELRGVRKDARSGTGGERR